MTDRYFLEKPPAEGLTVLAGPEAHHLLHVMRAKPGDRVTLFDGTGMEYEARVERLRRNEADLAVLSRLHVDREVACRIVLGVAVPKGDRQRWLVEKCVELGVARLVPCETNRGVAQPTETARSRLERAVIEAAKQCGRNRLMEIAPPISAMEYFRAVPPSAARFVAQPGGTATGHAVSAAANAASGGELFLAIGPEGGFSADELAAASEAGWLAVHLGPRTLRVETAALLLAALAIAGVEDDLGRS